MTKNSFNDLLHVVDLCGTQKKIFFCHNYDDNDTPVLCPVRFSLILKLLNNPFFFGWYTQNEHCELITVQLPRTGNQNYFEQKKHMV